MAFLPEDVRDGLHALAAAVDDATLSIAVVVVRTSGVSTRLWCGESNTALLQLRGAVELLADEVRDLYYEESAGEDA